MDRCAWFRKVFNFSNHEHLWSALLSQGVSTTYVDLLQKLYRGQAGVVQTDCLSKKFNIGRGLRQGDPIPPILFNAALEALTRVLCRKGSDKEARGSFCPSSLVGAKLTLSGLMLAAARLGVEVHEPKTKIIWHG